MIIPIIIFFSALIAIMTCYCAARAIPPLARAFILTRRYVNANDEELARRFVRAARADEELDDEDEVEDDLWNPDAEIGVRTPGHSGRIVRRSRRLRFAQKMAWWLRSEFPDAWRTRTTADDAVMRIAVARHMKELNVRNKDAVTLMPEILALVYLPTSSDVQIARMLATRSAAEAYSAHTGWAPRKTLMQRLGLSHDEPQFKLTAK